MSDLLLDLQQAASPALRTGKLAECEAIFTNAIRGLSSSPFHIVLDLRYTNPPRDVAAHFDTFFRQESARFAIAAAYTETDGSFVDGFAFDSFGGHDDYEWLSEWQSESFPRLALTGMEALQQVYDSRAVRQQEFRDAFYASQLLAISRFQQLIDESAPFMTELRFPLLATFHDFNFVSETQRRG